jgi:hypothetical protein
MRKIYFIKSYSHFYIIKLKDQKNVSTVYLF